MLQIRDYFKWKFVNFLNLISDSKEAKQKKELRHWITLKKRIKYYPYRHFKKLMVEGFHFNINAFYGKNVLDIGNGAITSVNWLNEFTKEYYAIDVLTESYRLLNKRLDKKHYLTAPCEEIPFPDSYFDYIYSFNSIDHIDDLDKGLNEVCRVLKPYGYFCVVADMKSYKTITEPILINYDFPVKLSNLGFHTDYKVIQKIGGVHSSLLYGIEETNLTDNRSKVLWVRALKLIKNYVDVAHIYNTKTNP